MGLLLDKVSLSFRGLCALEEVSFAVPDRNITALIGPNGAGKTSLLNVINGFYRPQGGTVSYDGTDLLSVPAHRILHLGIARSFQNVVLFDNLSVIDNLKVGIDHLGGAGLLRNTIRSPKARSHERLATSEAKRILEFLDLTAVASRRAAELDFGTRKLVDIGRALVARPTLLLLDEPSSGMTETAKSWLTEITARIVEQFSTSVLLVDHDMRFVFRVAAHVVAMNFGKVIAQGSAEVIRRDPQVIAAYLGEQH